MKNFPTFNELHLLWSSRPTMPLMEEVRRLTGPHGIFGRQYALDNLVDWLDVSYEQAAEILDCPDEDLVTVLIDADVAPIEGS